MLKRKYIFGRKKNSKESSGIIIIIRHIRETSA